MHSKSQTENSEHKKIPPVDHNVQGKRSSLQYQTPRSSSEKVSSLEERKPSTSRNHQKTQLRRNMTGGDDVVKYMSNVPSYLQRLEKGDSVQEKALNFGVLDWGRLEKWAYLQKQVTYRREEDSPSSSNSSTPASFSTFGSSSQSASRNCPCAQTKHSPNKREHCRSSEEGQIRRPNVKGVSIDKPQNPDVGSNKVKSQIGRSEEEEKSRNCEQQSFSGNLYFTEDWLQDQCSVVEGMWDNLQESEQTRRISCDSAAAVGRKSFSGNFSVSDISYSCPLPSVSRNFEPSISNNLVYENKVPRTSAQRNDMTKISSKQDSTGKMIMKKTNISDNSLEENSTSHTRSIRSITPHCLLRNSSLREISSRKEVEQQAIPSESTQAENATSSRRNRRSPLRRILDPLLKPKNQFYFSGTTSNLTSDGSQQVSNDSSVEAQKQVMSLRHAFLKLAWKNGLPLFVFSADDDNVLASIMAKGNLAQKNDVGCIYTMFTAHELKKKGRVWMGQGNKSKKNDFAYNMIGQVMVSSSKSLRFASEDYFSIREFVCCGTELEPTNHQRVISPFSNELAAIIIQVPNEKPKGSTKISYDELHNEQKNESSRLPSVTAILPNGIHGISSEGEPSSLIERWRSGGSCDCGGWDEGCKLTVLTDNSPRNRSSNSSAGARRIELLPQIEDIENKHIFKMTAFREEVYTVEFGASVASVQAFAMCIAILHSRKLHR
ncbi:uncharacterized protein A4U43_C02F670 [Asparagus officinalis]|uniref:Uncharacterized protein n=1 Tax=Asparagus officinalis TaxID=4686 RepID=A0A5P1FES2_ASPOF|nr:uncharacterized protein LOC109829811 [Asparagus officinalis]XP_020252446.1 uncharacterized protein LOC109829811 [Asparagus officinalis]XP_020252447.1 uncharacterized protein LOC109829811 [Asparagus officinalis]XP_020252448.1 uncharacterized protein LOC109829811 [Asparagus officinalis]ONK76866.1 uncharacterized protein A4U43_C02F670 [Asparagus officinalis]